MTSNRRVVLLIASFCYGLCLVAAAPLVPRAFAAGITEGLLSIVLIVVLSFGAWLFAVMARQ